MTNLSLNLLLLYFVFLGGAALNSAGTTDFIKTSCRATRYPALCLQCLSGYAGLIQQSQRQLAQTALSVSLARARSAEKFVSLLGRVKGIKPREHRAVKDCVENMSDSVDRLSHSVRELDSMGRAVGQDFMWHMSNVQTWVSAALTDENTCMDGFAGGAMDGSVKTAVSRDGCKGWQGVPRPHLNP